MSTKWQYESNCTSEGTRELVAVEDTEVSQAEGEILQHQGLNGAMRKEKKESIPCKSATGAGT